MRKAKLFLIGMAGVLLAFGMAGCDSLVDNAKKAAEAASGYTLTLARTTDGQSYTAELYSYNAAVGGGAAQSKNGSAIIKLTPYNGNPSFTGGTYTVRVISGSTVKEKASIAFATGGNTPLNWDTMTPIEEETDDENNEEDEETGEEGESEIEPDEPEIWTYASGNVALTLTEIIASKTDGVLAGTLAYESGAVFSVSDPQHGERFYYALTVNGTLVSAGTVTAGSSAWTFTSDNGDVWTAPVIGGSLVFSGETVGGGFTLPLKPEGGEDSDNGEDAGDDGGAQIEPSYGISLSKSGTHIFTPVTGEGYEAPAALTVTVGNTGNRPTGGLTVALYGDGSGSFALSVAAIDSIAAGASGSFTIAPETGLATGTYAATVTVSGGNGIEAGFNVSFTVGQAPVYAINLDLSGTWTFPAAIAGYGTQAAKTVNISNSGNRPTGNLTLALSSSAAFTLSATSVNSIAAGAGASFTVTPNTGLAAGSYSATVTASGGNGIFAGFSVNFTVNPPAESPVYGIALSENGTYPFPAATAGYGAQTAKSVTITNTGNQPTGNLTLALSNSTAFTLSATSINSIAVGASNYFTVTPKTGLSEGTYTATVTVSGGSVTSKNFSVSFTVNPAPTYGISLDAAGTHTFPSATAGYGAQTAKSVTITNTGNQPTGALTLALSNSTAFTLSSTAINSIGVNGSNSFTVTPKTGLAAGTYSATVTVSGASVTSKSFSVSWTVNPAPVYGISLTPETWTVPAATAGYGAQAAKSVTITNTGNQPTGNLTLSLSNSTVFTLSSTAINSIGVNGSNSFTVTPKTGLSAGNYSATVTVSGGSVTSKSFSVSWTVNAASAPSVPTDGWTSLASALAYLDSHSSGSAVNNPVPLKMNVNIASSTDGWVALSNALASRSKYIALDLSSCSMSGTDFDLYAGTIAGKNYIVSLVLPDAATSIANSSGDNSTYIDGSYYNNSYSKLSTVSGANIRIMRYYAFLGCTSLTTVSFPEATSIGGRAFYGCTALTSVSFPKVTAISAYMPSSFAYCTSLTTVNFPEATSIEQGAFSGCTALTSVSVPKATSISWDAFNRCTALTSVSFPEATSIGSSAFYGCTALTSVSFPEVTSIGNGAFWDCTALTEVSFPKAAIVDGFRDCTSLTSVSFPKVTSIARDAFEGCTSLTSLSFPEATSIGYYAFSGCTSLTSVFIPKVTTITGAFASTGTTPLTITMGKTAPTVGDNMFFGINGSRTVTIRVPSGATGYTSTWSNRFKGYGNGTGTVNEHINVVIQYGEASIAPVYGISLSPETWTFPAATAGYGAQSAKTVNISNTGNQPTGALTLALSNSTAFTLSTTSVSSIAAGGIATFTVTPKTDLSAGSYSATVTVSGGSVASKSFSVSFTVSAPAATPTYGISLSPETWTFPAATAGYGAQSAKTVNISNIGNQPTGALTLALSNSTAFTLSSTAINSIGVNGSNSFTVTPKTGLSAGSYSATVTVSGGSVTSKSFSVSWTVNPALVSSISLNVTGTYTFPSAAGGYGAQTAKSVTITNTDNQPTGNLTAALSGADSASFRLSTTTISSIAAGGNSAFTVTPKSNLAPGTYIATVTVSGGSVASKSFNVSFTVTAFTSSSTALAYLDAHTGGSTANNPVLLEMNVGISTLVNGLASRKKYIALDLSSCGGTTFDLNVGDVNGRKYIVSLILPDDATYMVNNTSSNGYTALKTVTGANIVNIGNYAFKGCPMTTVSFPAATSIGDYAFSGCMPLTEVSFPEATSIGTYAFYGCTLLNTVSFPEATSIGDGAFKGLRFLTSVSFPEVTYIKNNAFENCTGLTTALFPKAKRIGTGGITDSTTNSVGAFFGCTALTEVSFPEATIIDTGAFRGCTSLTTVDFPKVTAIYMYAFDGCTALTTASFPEALGFLWYIFRNCTSLTTLSIPKVTSIGSYTFAYTGTTPLTITMGNTAPSVAPYMFQGVTSIKNVTVRVPTGATGYTSTWRSDLRWGSGNFNLVMQYY